MTRERRDGAGRRVLVVEDEWAIAAEMAECLRDAGFDVLGPALTVPDALHLIEAAAGDGGIAAAVLDINLRGEPVAPVAAALTALRVPVLYATGYAADAVRDRCGAGPILEKPFDGDALIRGVRIAGTA